MRFLALSRHADERSLIDQLLADRNLSSLVTELYWEQEATDSPMNRLAWKLGERHKATLAHSYELFVRLRQAGIRAHPWV